MFQTSRVLPRFSLMTVSLLAVGCLTVLLGGGAGGALAQTTPPAQGGGGVEPYNGAIRKNDVVNVQIAGEPTLSGLFRVGMDDAITLPLVGSLKVAGLLPTAAADLIAGLYKKKQLLVDPQVVVSIVGRPEKTVFVSGALDRQGRVVINEKTRLDEVLEPAGVTANADLSKVVITRGETKISVDYLVYRSGKDTPDGKNNPILEDGDKIYIRARIQLSGTIKIGGEVRTPQTTALTNGLTLSQAIQQSGGVTEFADRDKVTLSRDGKDIIVAYKAIQEGQTSKDIPLQDKDEIFVPRLMLGSVKVNGEVRSPQTAVLTKGMTLAQAIQMAGGVTEFADRDRVTISRDGKEILVPYKAIQEGQTSKDLPLQDKDEIFVRRLEKPKVFHVTGGVVRANTFPISDNVTLSDAIAMSGGVQDGVDLKKIKVLRKTEKGEIVTRVYNLTLPEDLAAPVQAEDSISVPYPPMKKPKPDLFTILGALTSIGFLYTQFNRR